MEEAFHADRVHLQRLLEEHPDWKKRRYAEATGRSVGWVKKWKKRLLAAPDDPEVLRGLSRRPRHTPPIIHETVVQRILAIRDHPPDELRRVPGPLAIIYFLQQDEALKASGHHLPTSTSTIWRILKRHGRIARRPAREHEPLQRPEPMGCWQMDFKDVSTVPASREGKQQHVVETFNAVDEGSSLVLDAVVRDDFTMETAIWAAVHMLLKHGVPRQVTFDRDPRFVGAWTGRDFPSPFVRFWLTLGVQVNICPPRRPDKNAFVERYHRSYDQECLQRERPADRESTDTVTQRYVEHYNHQRPNQAITCRNQPPAQAFPSLPILPRLPEWVDPDDWLQAIDGHYYPRRLNQRGCLSVGDHRYYVRERLRGQYVNVRVDAQQRQLVIELQRQAIKTLPIKGLSGGRMDFETYFEWMLREARSYWHTLTLQKRLAKARSA
jgi:hypothetical protein